MLQFPFHQKLITNKVNSFINENKNDILIGAKPRTGKTYIVGKIIIDYSLTHNKFNILIITPVPSETISQYTDDLFKKYKEFKFLNIIHFKTGDQTLILKEKNIIITSIQLLHQKTLEQLKFNIIFGDEAHQGFTTILAEEILNYYSTINTVRIFLTATPHKPLYKWDIERTIYWSLEDEIFLKNSNYDYDKVYEKYGMTLTEKELLYYKNYPDLQILSSLFDEDKLLKQINNGGYSLTTLFSLTKKKEFQFKKEIDIILKYINKTYDRMIFDKKCTQIWFLPSNNINNISENLKIILNNHENFKNYEILIINSSYNFKNVKKYINNCEKNTNKGVIILAGNMLTLGITLNKCDVVILLNDTESSDRIIQMMYRCMTPREQQSYIINDTNYIIKTKKENGYVIDLNINRILSANLIFHHSNSLNTMNLEEKIKVLIKNNLIKIDDDMILSNKINSDELISKLIKMWTSNSKNTLERLFKRLEFIEIKENDLNELEKIFSITNENISNKIIISSNDISSGRTITKENNKINNKKEDKKIELYRDIFPYIIPLSCLLTLDNKESNLIKILDIIEKNEDLLEIFNDQSNIWWGNINIFNIIKKIIMNYINTDVLAITLEYKMKLTCLIEKPKELIEYINTMMKPKDLEKKQFGEVFTPLDFVNIMFDQLDSYYKLQHNGISIFSIKKFTWYDPACGIGNFEVILFERLMKGLKDQFSHEDLLKKHILENMIYVSDINKKNIFIYKTIFNLQRKYKLNILLGDSLQLEMLKKYDVIIGNPPFNQSPHDNNARTLPYFNIFTSNFIDKCQFMLFVIPSKWFMGGLCLKKFHKMMIERNDIPYLKDYQDTTKVFTNNRQISGGVCYFIKDSKYNGLTKFNNHFIKLDKYDIIIDQKYHSIIDKLIDWGINNNNLSELYMSTQYYGNIIDHLHDDYHKNNLKCYVSIQKSEKLYKFINKKYVDNDKLKYYKVITTHGHSSKGFGNAYCINKKDIYMYSYVGFKISSMTEALNLLYYIKECKFTNFLLFLRTATHHINKETVSWIPKLDFNIKWTDKKLYKYFKFTNDEIELVESFKYFG